jgi:hypothetical protein
MRTRATLERVPPRLAFSALAGMALLVSHDAIFLSQVGPGESLTRALREAGHEYWAIASLLLATIGLAAVGATILRIRGLRRAAAAFGQTPVVTARPYASRWLHGWARLLAVVAIGFLLQENVEHLIRHGHAPGFAALIGPEYPLALPVIGLITGVAALLAATTSQAERALLALIADALRRVLDRAPREVPRPPIRLTALLISPLARASAGRAPPRSFVSAS